MQEYKIIHGKKLEDIAEQLNALAQIYYIDIIHIQPQEGKLLLKLTDKVN